MASRTAVMGASLLLVAAAFLILLSGSAHAQDVTMICTVPGEDVQYHIPVTVIQANVTSFAVAQGCFEDFWSMPVTCTGGDITGETQTSACRTVVCEADDGRSMQVQACEKKRFFFFGDRYVEVYRQEPLNVPNGMSLCFGDNCVGEWGFARSDFLPYCRGEETAAADLSCIGAVQQGLLRGAIEGDEAVFMNDADRSFTVGTAIYAQHDAVIENQALLDSATGTVQANGELRLRLDKPVCAWQWDLFCGDAVIEDFDDEHYGDRNLYWEFSRDLPFCEEGQYYATTQRVATNDSARMNITANTTANATTNVTTNTTANVTANATRNATVNVSVAAQQLPEERLVEIMRSVRPSAEAQGQVYVRINATR